LIICKPSNLFVCHISIRWNANSSAVLPESDSLERVVYVVGILRSANPNTCPPDCLRDILGDHRRIAEAAGRPHIGAKQYLARHRSLADWQSHFGPKWDGFAARKARFDPLNLLAPGQGIFPKSYSPIPDTTTYSLQ